MIRRLVIAVSVLSLAYYSPVEAGEPVGMDTNEAQAHFEALIGDEYAVISTLRGEAASEGLEGMVAVAEVLRNRAMARGTTMSEEALRPKQFSFWNDRRAAARWLLRNPGSIEVALDALEVVKVGSDITKGADHYYADYIKAPYWARGAKETARIGRHVFLKGVK